MSFIGAIQNEQQYLYQTQDGADQGGGGATTSVVPTCPICARIHASGAITFGNTGGATQDTFTTTTNIVDAITTDGNTWVMSGTRGRAALVTYSFLDAIPAGSSPSDYPGFVAMDATQRAAVRQAFAAWAAVSGLSFLEVPASVGGMVQVGMHDFRGTSSAAFAGYATVPSSTSPLFQTAAINFMNSSIYTTPNSLDPGTGGFEVVLHEIGHNLGLGHPHDGPVRLVSSMDSTQYSVMSYNDVAPVRTTPGEGDLLAIRSLYGTDEQERANGITYVVNQTNWTIAWTGSSGDDVISGTNLTETITGGAGADWLSGGKGDDTIIADASDQRLAGGEGTDTLNLAGFTAAVNLSTYTSSGVSGFSGRAVVGSNTIALSGFESVVGTAFNDTLTGGSGVTLSGGAGDDTYVVLTGMVMVEAAGAGTDTVVLQSSTAHTLGDNIENARGSTTSVSLNVTGNALNNSLTGGTFTDTLTGGAGNDTLTGGGGFDYLYGGDGTDVAVMNFVSTSAQVARMGNGELIVRNRNGSSQLAITTGVESFLFSDSVTQQASALTQSATEMFYNLRTQASSGSGFDDSLSFYTGWNRSTTFAFDGSASANEELVLDDSGTIVSVTNIESLTGGAGADRVTLGGSGTTISLSGIESVTGSAGRDVVTIRAGAGLRQLDGGAGYDVVILSGRRADYTVTKSNGTVTVQGGSITATLTNIERLSFLDAQELVNLPSWQTEVTSLGASSGGQSFTVRQQSITETTDPSRGVLSSKVTVNGVDVTGVPATLKRGWRVATTLDIDGNGKQEIFFFGMEQVQGVGSGFGATWELGSTGAVERPQVHFQMRISGWEVAGAGNVNGLTGDEVIWQNVLTGAKAIWTDANRDGVVDGGFVIDGLGTNTAERIVGLSDLDKDGLQEFVLFNELTGRFLVYEATGAATGNVTVALLQEFTSNTALTTYASQQGATIRMFDIFTP